MPSPHASSLSVSQSRGISPHSDVVIYDCALALRRFDGREPPRSGAVRHPPELEGPRRPNMLAGEEQPRPCVRPTRRAEVLGTISGVAVVERVGEAPVGPLEVRVAATVVPLVRRQVLEDVARPVAPEVGEAQRHRERDGR